MDIPAAYFDPSARKGLPFALVGMGIVAWAIWGIYSDSRRVFGYQPVRGVVTNFIGPNKAAATDLVNGWIEYRYQFQGEAYSGSHKGMALGARPLCELPHSPGDQIEVKVNPAQPEVSIIDPCVNLLFVAMVNFGLPFAYLGLTIVWKGEDGVSLPFLTTYAIFSAIATAGVLAVSPYMGWRASTVIGLLFSVANPLLAKGLRRRVGLRRGGRSRSARVSSTREHRSHFLGGAVLTVVWWLSVAVMGSIIIQSLLVYRGVNERYQIAEGRIVLNEPADESWRVAYEFRVGDTLYTGDRVDVIGATHGVMPTRYPLNAMVTVYYDPADPNQSILEPGLPLMFWPLLGVLAIFILSGFTILRGVIIATHSEGMQVLRRAVSKPSRYRRSS